MAGLRESGFIDRIDDDIEARIRIGDERLTFGVDFLDDFLMGVWKQDLVLIGAYSGAGKTQLLSNIMLHNVSKGMKAFFFALEADEDEIERRIIYNLAAKYFYADDPSKRPKLHFNYGEFMVGNIAKNGGIHYEMKALAEFKKNYRGLKVFYKRGKYTIDDFILDFEKASSKGAQLVGADHAHFFDAKNEEEKDALKRIVSVMRTLNVEHKIPIILISHLRKRDYNNDWYAPPMEEFHGSSELYKHATKCITLGSGGKEGQSSFVTFMNIAKFRADGSRARAIGKILFDYKDLEYKRGYELGKPYQKRNQQFETIAPADYPVWAKGATRSGDPGSSFRAEPRMGQHTRGPRYIQGISDDD